MVSLDGASRITEGEEAEIWVDGSKIHLFDPATGENLTVDREHAGRIPRTRRRGGAELITAALGTEHGSSTDARVPYRLIDLPGPCLVS